MSRRRPKVWKDPYAARNSAKQLWANKIKPKLVSNITMAEGLVKTALDNFGANYIFQKLVYGNGYIAFIDFYIKKPIPVCLEIDGSHHYTKDGIVKDSIRTRNILRNHGYMTFARITNDEVLGTSKPLIDLIISRVAEAKRQSKEVIFRGLYPPAQWANRTRTVTVDRIQTLHR